MTLEGRLSFFLSDSTVIMYATSAEEKKVHQNTKQHKTVGICLQQRQTEYTALLLE